jgi:hypothetical protein
MNNSTDRTPKKMQMTLVPKEIKTAENASGIAVLRGTHSSASTAELVVETLTTSQCVNRP